MGYLRKAMLTVASEVAWRLPGWPARFVTSFADSERASGIDMLAAAEHTERGDLRRKYFLHALDESKHAALFLSRAMALGGNKERARAALDDSGTLQRHGTVEGRSMFERLGEMEFLAFVWVAEADAVEQFGVYLERQLPDPETHATLQAILKDEHFHVSYSRQELDRFRKQGQVAEVEWSLFRVRRDRWLGAWLRFSREFGVIVSGLWLGLAYAAMLGPFRGLAALEPGGWRPPLPRPACSLATARSQA
ncbi:MAG: ferritin-like domain-containing protein [Deltaproteobacteria bacterium]|nr:ferritin-like domain-containing protein [Deltaproteobacteria bacterium]